LRGHFNDKKPYEYVDTLQRRGYRLLKRVKLHEQETMPAAAEGVAAGPGPRAWKWVAAVIAAGFLAILALTFWTPGRSDVQSIAVLPLDNGSNDTADSYLVSGFKAELIQTLHNIPDLEVKNGRVNYADLEPREIADLLQVDSVLFGSVQRVGDTLKIHYEVAHGSDGVTILSDDITGKVGDIFALQERLAIQVRDELVGKSTQQLIKSRPSDSVAYDSYMRGVYALEHRGDQGKLEDAIELFQDSISVDPEYGPAYLSLATAYALLPDYRRAPVEEMNQLAIETVEQGVAVDPEIEAAAGAVYGFVYHKQKRWLESEAAYRRAINAMVVDSNAFNWYSRMLSSVGRLEDALVPALDAAEIDPSSAIINSRIAIVYTWLGNPAKAHEYFRRANSLDASGSTYLFAYAFQLIRDGQFEQAQNLTLTGLKMFGAPTAWVEPAFAAFEDPVLRPEALLAVDEAAAGGYLTPQLEFTLRGKLGDTKGALRVAELLKLPGEAFEMELLFIPEMQDIRADPQFMVLLESLGILDYWAHAGCTWNGRTATCG
jgi:TolB-like protein